MHAPLARTAIMQAQTQQQPSSADGPQAANGQSGQAPSENRAPNIAGYPQALSVNGHIGGPHLQNQQRLGAKFGTPIKGTVPLAMSPFDLSGARTLYNGQLVYLSNGTLPNGALFNGVPPASSFYPATMPGQDQLGQLPYLSTGMYPNVSPNCSILPGTIPGYTVPYLMNNEVQDPAGQKRTSCGSHDESKSVTQPSPDTGTQQEYYPNSTTAPSMDGSSLPSYQYNMAQLLGPPCLPLQMMKTSNGYVLQDLEALTQQEPAIPRAVPAMWTNPSEMTLAKCLENREGITNVYIRGFLPETTDEMLYTYASRFGKIDRCKAIVDLDSGHCKGYIPDFLSLFLDLKTNSGRQIWLRAILQFRIMRKLHPRIFLSWIPS